MEESAILLFQASTTENDPSIRLRKIIRACKLITDILPKEDLRNSLLEEKELFQYLILNYFFHKNSLEMIISAIFHLFENNDIFLNTCWKNLEFIGAINDSFQSHSILQVIENHPGSHNKMVSKLLKEKYEKSLYKELAGHIVSIPSMDFNKDIQKKIIKIKNFALDYANIIFNIYVNKEMSKQFMEEKVTLYKIYLLNTGNEKIMSRVCKNLVTIKSHYSGMIRNISHFESQITDILKNKSESENKKNELPFTEVKDAYINVMETPSPLLPIKNILSIYNLGKKNSEIYLNENKLKLYEENQSQDESSEDEKEEAKELAEFEKEKLERERIDKLFKKIEKWLCMNDENLIEKDEEMSLILRSNENLEMLLLYLTDPFKIIPDPMWANKYEEIAQRNVVIDYKAFKLDKTSKNRKEVLESRMNNFYYLRSFKAMSVLCIRKNIKFLLNSNENSLTLLFNNINLCLSDDTHQDVNLYHIGTLIENYLILEPNVSCEHVIKVNLLTNLIKNVHNPLIFEIVLNILEPNTSRYEIFGESQVKIWEWCYENSFFQSIVSLLYIDNVEKMLEEDAQKTEEILENSKQYYSGQKTQLIKKEIVKKFAMFQFLINENKNKDEKTINIDKFLTLDECLGVQILKSNYEYIYIEELNGSKLDIDNLKSFILNKSNNILKKPNVFNKNTNTLSAKLKEKIMIKNPVSNEKKLDKTHNISEEKEISLNKSTLDVQMGFTISKVKNLYPNRFIKEQITNLDKIILNSEYKVDKLIEHEKISLPVSMILYWLLNSIIENEEMSKMRDILKKKKVVGSLSLIDMFLNSAILFEKIYLNFLLKIQNLTKGYEFNNSAFESAKIIHLILKCLSNSNCKAYEIIKNHKDNIIKKCKVYFDFFTKVIIGLYNIKKLQFSIQKYDVFNPVGYTRILILEILYYMCKLTINEKISLINEVHPSIWHMIIIWFFGNRSNDLFLQLTYNFLSIAFEKGSEDTLVNLLFKVNLIGSLYNAYDEFIKNEVIDKDFYIDSFMFYSNKIVKLIVHIDQTKGAYPSVKTYLKDSQNWKKLKKAILTKKPILNANLNQSKIIK